MIIKRPRGTKDYIYELDPAFSIICQTCQNIAKKYGLYEIKTPIFESKELFVRTAGDDSDIVNKEFYEFNDKNDRQMVLRPELTAPICRAIVENNLLNAMQKPIKFFYIEPMFRYERPQSGRLRMFHQFGVEYIGANSYFYDINLILMSLNILQSFGIKDFVIKINNICGFETRKKWIDALKKYFQKYYDDLTEDSQKRLAKNPLRILDDKIDGKKDFVKKAPQIIDFATDDEKKYFERRKNLLDRLNIKYKIDPTLVRGLDYYTDFVFEIESTSKLLVGQPTLIGGGRYNKMIAELGGKETNCVGFALGIERLMIALENNKILSDQIKKYKKVNVYLAYFNPKNTTENEDYKIKYYCFELSKELIDNEISCICNFNIDAKNIKKHFQYAQDQCAQYVIIVGQKEIKDDYVTIKDQTTMQQKEVKRKDLVKYIKTQLDKNI